MAKKIKITESQLKMIAEHNSLNESFGEPESVSFENNEDLLNSISERLSDAIQMEDWDLVKEVYSDLTHGKQEEEPIDYTMGRHDDPNMLPNPPKEIRLDLNEGQLLLKKVYTQFK
jgi:hypothetical protein